MAGLQRSRTAHDSHDILIEDTGLNAINIPNQHDEAYRCYPRSSGAVALTSEVLPSNHLNTFMDKQILPRQYSIDELLDFGRNRLDGDARVEPHAECPTS